MLACVIQQNLRFGFSVQPRFVIQNAASLPLGLAFGHKDSLTGGESFQNLVGSRTPVVSQPRPAREVD